VIFITRDALLESEIVMSKSTLIQEMIAVLPVVHLYVAFATIRHFKLPLY
jgi:hypothetical protein